MNTVRFTIPFVAVQQRSRKGHSGWYSPSSGDQKVIGQFALAARRNIPLMQGKVHFILTIYGGNKLMDGDNALKLVMDSCNKILYPDDRQIVFGSFRKIENDQPRMDIEVFEIE